MKKLDINEALRIYLGADAQGGVLPYGMEERIQAAYGVDSNEVLAEVRRAVEDLLEPDEAFQLPSLQAIAAVAAERARSRRPDLQDGVCRAIGNYISYGYR